MRAVRWFRVFLRGSNFVVRNHDSRRRERLGWYTTRYVRAAAPDEAELKAVDAIRKEARLRRVTLNIGSSNPPRIYCKEISPCPRRPHRPVLGFVFYPQAGRR